MTSSDLLRASWGLVLLTRPQEVSRAVQKQPANAITRRAARALGARQLLQAAVLAVHSTSRTRTLGAGVDLLHAVSMLALAVRSRRWRRVAVTETCIATAFAVATARSGPRLPDLPADSR